MSNVTAHVQQEAVAPEKKPGFWNLMKNRNYRYLLLAQFVSDLGDGVYALGLLWAIKVMTGSGVQMSMVLTAELIPTILLSLVAGVLVDRGNKKRFMLSSDLARGVVVAAIGGLWLLHLLAPWMLIVAAALLSSCSAFFTPARMVAVRTIVPAETMLQAQSVSQTMQTVVGLCAPAIAAVLLSVNFSFAFFFNAASFLISFLLIALVRPEELIKRLDSKLDLAALRASMKEGVRTIISVPILRNLMTFAVVLNLLFAPVSVLFPIYANTATELATFETAFFIGILVGSIVVGFMSKWPKVVTISMGLFIMLIGFAGLSYVHSFVYAVGFMFLTGLGNPLPNVTVSALFSVKVPREVLGRAASMMRMMTQIASPVSLSLVGSMMLLFDVRQLFLYIAVLGALVTVALMLNPAIRQAE
ncbi:MAG: MFS transporter [Tumebacillaceae bacterium]